jgi:hypothetical protein
MIDVTILLDLLRRTRHVTGSFVVTEICGITATNDDVIHRK